MKLADVHLTDGASAVLWSLLKERPPEANISHRKMPTRNEHDRFVNSRPYKAWYLLRNGEEFVGSVYLTDRDEIGIFIFKAHQGNGYGRQAVEMLMARHKRDRYLANVNPANAKSISLFRKLGFVPLQMTYELKP